MNCLAEYMAIVRQNAPLPAKTIDDLEWVLQCKLDWKLVQKLDSHDCNAFEAYKGDWHFVLADFSIADQPGRSEGERGQNMSIRSKSIGVVLMGDDPVLHRLANWLFVDQILPSLDSFLGTGKARPIRVKHFEQTAQRYNIDSPEKAGAAALWLDQHIRSLNGAVWGIEETGSYYKFDEATHTARHWGNPHEATTGLLKLMGWNVTIYTSTY